ncbi:MAG: hypothetical protein HC838_06250 [Spirulinaceae cyanobacterium RM2_2_10]|nr:hypothetical protein [Spirulinaceae cyanobacterium SM2_1_0]NJO19743.1 hypothetical protein [Spirulinaceae cyanobacterium RM2_2_10]
MSGGVYLIQDGDQLVEMSERPYDSEALLQELIERYPNLLAVEQATGSRSTLRQWLIVKRLGSLPMEDVGATDWALNHLFLDRQAIPTLVDVKRDSDQRPHREIVGQMLDYAANAVVYWPVESILAQFEANCRRYNRDPEQILEEFLGPDIDEEQFWQQVKTNLQAGKIRLIFVADQIEPEMQRVVEFLNKQVDPAEVLAVEVKQYISQQEGLRTLVSKVIGQTAEAQQRKAGTTRERRQWDEASFLAEYEARYGEDDAAMIKKIYDWIQARPDLQLQWATGDSYGGFAARLAAAQPAELFFAGIDGTLQVSSDVYAVLPPFNHQSEWYELRNRFSSIGLALPINPSERRYPKFQLSALPNTEAIEPVLSTFEWVIDQLAKA